MKREGKEKESKCHSERSETNQKQLKFNVLMKSAWQEEKNRRDGGEINKS